MILSPEQILTASQTYPQGPNQCLNGALQGIGEELVWSILLGPAGPAGPLDMLLSAYIGCMTSGNGSGGGDSPRHKNLTDSEDDARKSLGLTKIEFRKAIHEIKRHVEGNPDMLIDKVTGDVYDARSMEWMGNLLDHK